MTAADDYTDGTYENSELYRYFKEIGIVDSEELNGSIIFTGDLHEEKQTDLSTAYQWRSRSLEYLKCLLKFEGISYLHAAVESILESMLMIREDSYHVERIISQAQLHQHRNRSPPFKPHVPLLLFITVCVFYELPVKLLCGTLILLATIFIVGYIWKKFHILHIKRKLKNVRQLLFLQNEMILQVKKSLSLLRHRSSTALDSKMSTMDSVFQSSCVDKSAFLEQYSTIPMLRKCLLEILINMTKYVHSVTKNLIETVPLLSQVDNTQGYFCNCNWSDLELQEFSPNCDGNITLETLQRLASLYIVIQSEFLRRLSLSLCPEALPMCTRDVTDSIWEAVENVSWKITRNSFKLMKHYWLYCGYENQRNIFTTRIRPKQVLSQKEEFFHTFQEWFLNVHEIVNSVSFCIKQVEPKTNIKSEDTNYDSELYEMLENVMVELGALLKKSDSYFDICFKKLKKLHNNLSVEENQGNTGFAKVNEDKRCKILPVEYNDIEQEAEDEVFEDVAFSDFQIKDERFDAASIIEEAKDKIRKKHYAMLLSELKTALSHRAEETQEREVKALQKKKLQTLECSNSTVVGENFNSGSDTERHSNEVMFDELKELCPSETVPCSVKESQCDLPVTLSVIEDCVRCGEGHPKHSRVVHGSSQLTDTSGDYSEDKSSSFKTTVVKLPLSIPKRTSDELGICDTIFEETLCASKGNVLSPDNSQLCKVDSLVLNKVEEMNEGKSVSGEHASVLQSSLFAELAVKAASTAQKTKFSSVFPLDCDDWKLNMENALSFARNTTQLTEETFSFDPDEEN